MSKVTAVKEAVKETLVGSTEPPQLSAQTKARFNRHALKDPETGELYLGAEQFIDAIAPPHEDYVSRKHCRSIVFLFHLAWKHNR
jgi:solute carrier family 25 aspartate/glutamate transporter 12/13